MTALPTVTTEHAWVAMVIARHTGLWPTSTVTPPNTSDPRPERLARVR